MLQMAMHVNKREYTHTHIYIHTNVYNVVLSCVCVFGYAWEYILDCEAVFNKAGYLKRGRQLDAIHIYRANMN